MLESTGGLNSYRSNPCKLDLLASQPTYDDYSVLLPDGSQLGIIRRLWMLELYTILEPRNLTGCFKTPADVVNRLYQGVSNELHY